MTFLEEVKDELSNLRGKKPCCMKAELRGILAFGAAPYMGHLIYGTDSLTLAKRVSSFLRRTCNIDYTERLDEAAESYKFLIPDDILARLGIAVGESIILTENCENEECCRHAFVRGAFLSAGSAASPERAYRVEIFSENEEHIEKVLGILGEFNVAAKKTKRKNLYVIYANSCEAASDFLKVAESVQGVFALLDARVVKDRRNETNRQINCDMANINRAAKNAEKEIEAIKKIERTIGLEALPPKLRAAALLRLENDIASLSELAALCDPPVPKSTINNRLNKLIKIAEEID